MKQLILALVLTSFSSLACAEAIINKVECFRQETGINRNSMPTDAKLDFGWEHSSFSLEFSGILREQPIYLLTDYYGTDLRGIFLLKKIGNNFNFESSTITYMMGSERNIFSDENNGFSSYQSNELPGTQHKTTVPFYKCSITYL
ncbi:MAG: hypothetical protein K2Q18_07485 [Bdellovibrionales bacterium]|nr:hypothetical protein [Bdellovibrionales bacterium]